MAAIITENRTQIENSFSFVKHKRKLINFAPYLNDVLYDRREKE